MIPKVQSLTERKAQCVPVDIRGAKGPSASSINGIYEPTNEICGGWLVYRKRGDADKWLEFYDPSNKWYIKPTTDKGRAKGWFRIATEPPSRPELSKSIGEVWDGAKWIPQNTANIMTVKRRLEEDKELGMQRKAQCVPVDIRGAKGPSASSINGIYEPTNELCGGWPVYKKQDDHDKWLEFIASKNEWYIKPTTDRGRPDGWMRLLSDPAMRPELVRGVCEVWDGDVWIEQPNVVIMAAISSFHSMTDIKLFCHEEIKVLQDKIDASLRNSIDILTTGNKRIDKSDGDNNEIQDAYSQLDAISIEVSTCIEQLKLEQQQQQQQQQLLQQQHDNNSNSSTPTKRKK